MGSASADGSAPSPPPVHCGALTAASIPAYDSLPATQLQASEGGVCVPLCVCVCHGGVGGCVRFYPPLTCYSLTFRMNLIKSFIITSVELH